MKMGSVTSLQLELLRLSSLIARQERHLVEHPGDPILLINLQSLEKRMRAVEAEFVEYTSQQGVGVYRYRIFEEDDLHRPAGVTWLAGAMSSFQTWFATTLVSIRDGSKRMRALTNPRTSDDGLLRLAYFFPGSTGVVLTSTPQLVHSHGNLLRETTEVMMAMPRHNDAADYVNHARTLGPAAVRAFYRWAKCHSDSGTGAELVATGSASHDDAITILPNEFREITRILGSASDESSSVEVHHGTLIGIDLEQLRFRLAIGSGKMIVGKVSPTLRDREISVNHKYRANIAKITRILFSMEEEQREYELTGLDDLREEAGLFDRPTREA